MVKQSGNMRGGDADLAKIKRELIEKGVRYCLASYVDMHGIAKAKAVPVDHFERMMRGSELFTGAAVDGLGQGPNDDELAVFPDPAAVVQLPWRPEIAWCPGNLKFHKDPWPMCSRTILAAQVERARKMGYRFNLGIECEIYVVRREGDRLEPANPKDVIPRAAYDVINLLEEFDWCDEMIRYMNEMGWNVHSLDHEDANSQFEFDFAYSDVMTMADRYVLFRMMAKEIARRYGYEATFMPKPWAEKTGSGAHFNMSLDDLKTGKNVMGDSRDKRGCGLSKVAYQFIAGVLAHGPAIAAVTCPTVNSYKRLVKTGSMTGFTWAPIYVTYGYNNRTNMMRVPWIRPEIEGDAKSHKGVYLSSARLECRAVDTACNPYLAAAMMLAAGLDGIEKNMDPGNPNQDNLYLVSEGDLKKRKIETLPRTLLEAVEAFQRDPFGKKVLGEGLYNSFIELKGREWWNYHNTVSTWELDNYLTKF
ncbi:MAG: type III glutamate--ammonia ligase [Alphaproteobacteria bacterium]